MRAEMSRDARHDIPNIPLVCVWFACGRGEHPWAGA